MHVYVHLLTWNGFRYLPEFFASIDNQTYKKTTLRVMDNGSTDETIEYLREHYPKVVIGRNVKNLGFAKGHNQLMEFTLSRLPTESGALIMYVNQDMILEPDCIEKMVEVLRLNPSIDAVQPKLYRAFGEVSMHDEIVESVKSDILDSTGLRVKKGWSMTDRGAGELDKKQYDEDVHIISPSGAIGVFRSETIRDISIDGQFFDEDFFSYKEDCDVAWRFAKAEHFALFEPKAIAYHHRGVYGAEKMDLWTRIKNHRNQNAFLAALSTRNQWYLVLKHIDFISFILYSPWLVSNLLLRSIYAFIFESQSRKMLFYLPKDIPSLLDKRAKIKEKTRVRAKDLRLFIE